MRERRIPAGSFKHLARGIALLVMSATAMASRPVTIRDVIEMSTVSRNSQQSTLTYNAPVSEDSVGLRSPDGKRFALVTQRGDLATDANEYTLSLFTPTPTGADGGPEAVASMRSTSNRPAIQRLQWLDNGSLAFLGEREHETQQLFRISTATHQLEQLTSFATNVSYYAFSGDRREVFVITEVKDNPLSLTNVRAREILVEDQALTDLLTGSSGFSSFRDGALYEIGLRDGQTHKIEVSGGLGIPILWPSPDGRYLLVESWHKGPLPQTWTEYTNARIASAIRSKRGTTVTSWVAQLTLVDCRSRTEVPFVAAPVDSRVEAIWAQDGRSVLLSKTLLPLDVEDDAMRRQRLESQYVVKVDIASGKIQVVARGSFHILRWDQNSREIVLASTDVGKDGLVDSVYLEGRNGWVRDPQVRREIGEIDAYPRVELRDGPNDPPKLFYAVSKSSAKLIWDLNPRFDDLAFAPVEQFTFSTKDLRRVRAELYTPVSFASGKKYPLVIQTHGSGSLRFTIDGPGPTAFAAQPLASRGFLVVTLPEDYPLTGKPDEVPEALADMEGVVAHLSSLNVLDPNRIGIIGWSRTGFHVAEALTRPSIHFAAATMNDFWDAGYFSYVAFLNQPMYGDLLEAINGGAMPYGKGLSEWLRLSPDFKLDKVETPVWMSVHSEPSSLFTAWEWFVGLRRLNKPVELIYMDDGAHSLVRPAQREVSLEGNLDWFSFWLQGFEDPDPAKADQYRRWEKLCDQQLAQKLPFPSYCVSTMRQ